MKPGARNQITGTVKDIAKGGLMTRVRVTVDGPIDLSSVMTIESLEEMGLADGDQVTVVVKAVNVLLVKS